MAYLMGIDLGTSSLKVLIMSEEGNVKGIVKKNYQFDSPKNGYAEQDPEVWWQATCSAIKEVIGIAGISSGDIRGVGFSGQMHGLVMLDAKKDVVRPAILHCDARSAEQVELVKAVLGKEQINKLLMNPIYTGFLVPSLLWVKENEFSNYQKVAYVCLPKDYLRYRLSGEIGSDYSDASATLGFDIQKGQWSKEVLAALDIPETIFPKCTDATAIAGTVTKEAATLTGLCKGTVVVAGGGDQVMQAIGNGVIKNGEATVNIGTSGQVCFQSSQPICNLQMNTNTFLGYQKNHWIVMGATMSAGLSLAWLKSLFIDWDYEVMNKKIEAIPPGSNGIIYLPYLMGERTPHLNPNISGMMLGLTTCSDGPHLARAIMEGVAYSLMQCMEVCKNLGLEASTLVASGGGVRSKPWVQLQADLYNKPLKVAKIQEQACVGAAIAAGVGIGCYRDVEEGCRRVIRYEPDLIVPREDRHRIYLEYYDLYKEAYQECHEVLEKVTMLGRR